MNVLEMFELPHTISDIKICFDKYYFYVGSANISKCTKVEISFENQIWTIKAVFPDGECVKRYRREHITDNFLTEIEETDTE